jgi:hypothetical protein
MQILILITKISFNFNKKNITIMKGNTMTNNYETMIKNVKSKLTDVSDEVKKYYLTDSIDLTKNVDELVLKVLEQVKTNVEEYINKDKN